MTQSQYSVQSSLRSFNAAQVLVTDPLNKVILHHFIPEFVPIFISRTVSVINYFTLSYYLTPLDAANIYFVHYFMVAIFGVLSEAFTATTYFYIQRYLHEQQLQAASTHLTYSMFVRTVFIVIATACVYPLADKMYLLLTGDANSEFPFYFKFFSVTALLNFALEPEIKAALQADQRLSVLVWRAAVLAGMQMASYSLYFFVIVSQQLKFSIDVFTYVQVAVFSLPQLALAASFIPNFYFLSGRYQNLFFNLKLLFPFRWMLVSLILIKFFEGLLFAIGRPMTNMVVIYLMLSREYQSEEMDQLMAIYIVSFVILSEVSQTATDAFAELTLRFTAANQNNHRMDRIHTFLRQKLWKICIACTVYAVVTFLFTSVLVPLYVRQITPSLQKVETIVNILPKLQYASVAGICVPPYSFVMAFSRAKNDRIRYILSGCAALSDLCLLAVAYFFGQTYDVSNIIILSALLRGTYGTICWVWELRLCKGEVEVETQNQNLGHQVDDLVQEEEATPLMDLKSLAVSQSLNLNHSGNDISTKLETSDFLTGIRTSQISGGGFGVNEGVFNANSHVLGSAK